MLFVHPRYQNRRHIPRRRLTSQEMWVKCLENLDWLRGQPSVDKLSLKLHLDYMGQFIVKHPELWERRK